MLVFNGTDVGVNDSAENDAEYKYCFHFFVNGEIEIILILPFLSKQLLQRSSKDVSNSPDSFEI
ncbi:13060_t:CDS:2 [Funneliformis geosporum]|uniref:13060_t:CDS:1 n=1 Tax=Funneliformis geosporum TaxID=1117311 RepID=A0A9W4X2H6_9GLOM|nr:13060_t:CDS:2 [Funneliformis geosporum]